MRVALAVVPVETVESLLVRSAARIGRSEPPLAEAPGGVAGRLEGFRNRDRPVRNRALAGKLAAVARVAIGADLGVAKVLAGEQDAAGRSTDRRSGVMPGEAHPFLGKLVEVRGPDLLLPVGSEFTVTQVVGQDEDNVGRGRRDAAGMRNAARRLQRRWRMGFMVAVVLADPVLDEVMKLGSRNPVIRGFT
jgi:hypothetical protein